MDLIDKLILPQSAEHIELLHYLLMLVLFLFIPFISVVIGGLSISIFYRRRGMEDCHSYCLRLAKDVINTVTVNKSTGIILGILPLLTSALILAQLLHTSKAPSVAFMLGAFVLISIGIILVYAYRYSLDFENIFGAVKYNEIPEDEANEIRKFNQGNLKLGNKSAIYSLLLIFPGIYLFVAALSISGQPQHWDFNAFYTLLSINVLLRFFEFIAFAFLLTGSAIMFAFFFWEREHKPDQHYTDFVKGVALKVSVVSSMFIPIFILLSLLVLPKSSLSGWVFGFAGLGLFAIFIAFLLFYAIGKVGNLKASGATFFVILFAMLSLIIKDQLAMSNATQKQSVMLAGKFEEYMKRIGGDRAAVEVSGKELFDVRCASCHQFDTKLVGPAYKQTLPKYEGKEDQLVAFILNPTKVDPAFPPMPNPGLKPNEAKAVAKYILEQYKK